MSVCEYVYFYVLFPCRFPFSLPLSYLIHRLSAEIFINERFSKEINLSTCSHEKEIAKDLFVIRNGSEEKKKSKPLAYACLLVFVCTSINKTAKCEGVTSGEGY